jgi:GH35 family endo-1,4-beta-xylanase
LTHYILDHGADPSLGFSHAGALWVALTASRSTAVMKDLIEKGAPINGFTMSHIIRHKRADILECLFSIQKFVHQVDCAMNDPQKTLDNARKADNEEVIALVNDYIEKREMRRGGMHKLPVRDEKEKSEVGEMESNTEKPW